MKKTFLALLSTIFIQVSAADPSVAQAREVLDKMSKHLVAGEYEQAFALRSDPYTQVVTRPDGTKAELQVSKAQALQGMEILKQTGKLSKLNKHEVKIIETANEDGFLLVTAKVTVDPGIPSKAYYSFKEEGKKVLIVREEYVAEE